MPVKTVRHNGKSVFYVDYRGMGAEDMLKMCHEAMDEMAKSPRKLLVLTNVHGCTVSKKFMQTAKERGKEVRDKVDRSAIVGVVAIQKVLVAGFNRVTGDPMKVCSTEEEALEHLTS